MVFDVQEPFVLRAVCRVVLSTEFIAMGLFYYMLFSIRRTNSIATINKSHNSTVHSALNPFQQENIVVVDHTTVIAGKCSIKRDTQRIKAIKEGKK